MKIGPLSGLLASVITSGMQLWHKFTASTWSGSNRLPDSSPVATNTGALFTGRGLSFDGVNDVVTVGATGATVKTIVFYAKHSTSTQVFMQLQSTGAVRIEAVSDGLTTTGITSPTRYVNGVSGVGLSTGDWQFLAVTTATGISASNVLFGQSNTSFLSGGLSNIKFFSTELSAGQIAELYANPEQALPTGSTAADLVGWWPLQLNGSIANDVKQNKAGVVSGATPEPKLTGLTPQIGPVGIRNTMIFDGTDDYTSCSNYIPALSDFTILCWHAMDNSTASVSLVRMLQTGTAAPNCYLYITSSGLIGMTDGVDDVKLSSATGYKTGTLALSGLTFSGGGTKTASFYHNGTACGTQVFSTWGPPTAINQFNVAYPYNSYGKGHIFAVMVWDKVLTSSEITSLYNSGSYITPLANSGNYASATNCKLFYLNTGNTVADWVNLANPGTMNATSIVGSPANSLVPIGLTSSTDQFGFSLLSGGYLTLDGSSYASVSDAATLDITTTITLEGWVKPFSVSSAQTIIGKNGSYALGITSAGKPVFTKWTSTAVTATATTTTTVTANTWAHLAATYDGANVKIYINGALNTTTAVTGAIDATSAAVLLGAKTTSTELFSGCIDSVKVYNTALTAADIAKNYAAERGQYA